MYAAVVIAVFVPLYLLTRSDFLISDGPSRVMAARSGDHADIQYFYPLYVLGVPLINLVWVSLTKLGLTVSVESVLLGLSLCGTVAAIVFMGLIAAQIAGTRSAAWLAAALFGTALNPWTQWNGELSGWSAGFGAAALYLVLRNRTVAPALLWALAVLSHVDFVLLAPVLVLAVWMGEDRAGTTRAKIGRAVSLVVVAATVTLLFLFIGSWLAGKWHDTTELATWLGLPVLFESHVQRKPEVFRAIKGFVTAYTVAGHHLRNVLTGRGTFDNPAFVGAVAVGLVLLVVTGVLIVSAVRQRRAALFALTWLLPFHVLYNWWYAPTMEEYHTGALPGLVLLITAGLLQLGLKMSRPWRSAFFVSYIAACFGLNLVSALLPMKAAAAAVATSSAQLRQLSAERNGRIALVTCDGGPAVEGTGIEYLRIRNHWKRSVPDIQNTIRSWIEARIGEGKEVYVQNGRCLPDEWVTPPHPSFDLSFLERDFRSTRTPITGIFVPHSSPTDLLAWSREDLVRLEPRH
jgi:hypothetical protein